MLGDVTDAFLRRHMTVARAKLVAPGPASVDDAVRSAAVAAAQAAALQAAKMAALILPGMAPFQLTDCFTDVAFSDEAAEVTVTLQAYHRASIEGAAALAAAAAAVDLGARLAPSRGQPTAWRLQEVHIVQSVRSD